jgi:hypothetical protein
MIIHELGHVWDNRSRSGFGDVTIFGGGLGDDLYKHMGGTPSGLRFTGVVSFPSNRRDSFFPPNVGTIYGNNSQADYFAHTFAGTTLNSSDVPDNAKKFMAALIDQTK